MTRTYHKAENHSRTILDMWDRRKLTITQIGRALDMDRKTVRTHLRKHGRVAPKGENNDGLATNVILHETRMPGPMPDFSSGNRMYVVDGVMPAVVDEDGTPVVPDRVGGILTALAAILVAIVCVLVWNAVS